MFDHTSYPSSKQGLFEHALVEIEQLKQINTDSGRWYEDPLGVQYASVTTILGSQDHDWLNQWREMVGEEEAERQAGRAANRGTNGHQICEDYLSNKPDYLAGHMPINKLLFRDIHPWLDKHVGKIFGIELRMFSKFLHAAGTADLIAEWDGKMAVIDFKTSNKEKERDEIEDYFMQSAAYCVMFEERTGIPVDRFVIVIAVEKGNAQIFYGERDKYIQKFIALGKEVRHAALLKSRQCGDKGPTAMEEELKSKGLT